MEIRDPEKIVDLLEQARALLPEGSALALVIVMPPDTNGWQDGHTVDTDMDADTRAFAVECLANPGDGQALSRQVH